MSPAQQSASPRTHPNTQLPSIPYNNPLSIYTYFSPRKVTTTSTAATELEEKTYNIGKERWFNGRGVYNMDMCTWNTSEVHRETIISCCGEGDDDDGGFDGL